MQVHVFGVLGHVAWEATLSIIAGIFSRHGRPVAELTCAELHKAVSRNQKDQRIVHRDHLIYLVKVDVGAYGEPAFRVDPRSGSVAMMAGDTLLRSGRAPRSRPADLAYLQEQLDARDAACLDAATGIFALVHYDSRSSRLTLATDKVGLRPFYYWIGEDYVVFATASRILEAVSAVPKRMDLVGVTELTVSPYYQGNERTAYADIKRQRGATVMTVECGAMRRQSYYDWRNTVLPDPISEDKAVARAHDRFVDAIKRRLGDDRLVPACLSGGLDSRSVVAGLRSVGAEVCTFTFYALPQSQERVFAAQFAHAAGTNHTEIASPLWEGGESFEREISSAWSKKLQEGLRPEHPQLLWTGDGGSVSLGHVYVGPEQVRWLRSGDADKAAMSVRRGHLTSSVLKPKWARRVEDAILRDFRQQMKWIGGDPGRAFHLYLILNEQRDDFREHFENVDLHRMEFQAPFYDPDFIASVLSLPIDICVRHKFYLRWLRLLPHAAEVPWSSYPTHEPCPLPQPEGLASQWGNEFITERYRVKKKRLVSQSMRILVSHSFPGQFLKAGRAGVATLLHWAGVRDCSGVLASLAIYHRYWERCGRQYGGLEANTPVLHGGPDTRDYASGLDGAFTERFSPNSCVTHPRFADHPTLQ